MNGIDQKPISGDWSTGKGVPGGRTPRTQQIKGLREEGGGGGAANPYTRRGCSDHATFREKDANNGKLWFLLFDPM